MGSALFKLLPDKNRENELLNRIRIRENLHLDPSKRQIDWCAWKRPKEDSNHDPPSPNLQPGAASTSQLGLQIGHCETGL